MKLRNRLIALACFLLFLGLVGFLTLITTGRHKPFAVILFVADNLNPTTIAGARIHSGGGDSALQMESLPFTALCRNNSSDYSVPDAAAAATQIACGQKVPNNRLCVNASGAKLPSLLESAFLKGRSTGLISSGPLDSPTAASFFAKAADASMASDLLTQYRDHDPFDFVVTAALATNTTNATSPLIAPQETAMVTSLPELEAIPFWKRNNVHAQLSPTLGLQGSLPLSDLVRLAIGRLQLNGKGYLLVVDDPGMGSAASLNDGESMLRRLVDFDRAIAVARQYAGENSLIVVTGRENIGGFSLNTAPFLRDKGVAVVSMNNLGYPSICWSTGPGFAPDLTSKSGKTPGILSQPSAFQLPRGVGTAGDVMAAGAGPGAQALHGFLDLTEIHRIINEAL